MKKIEKNAKKRGYSSPEIICIELDNEISLALESSPPVGPNETTFNTPHYINNDPFKANIS